MEKKLRIASITLLSLCLICLGYLIYQNSNSTYPASEAEKGIIEMQNKLDSIKTIIDSSKKTIHDTLIVKQNDKKVIEKHLQDVNHYYTIQQTVIDTMPINDTVAKKYISNWVLRDKQGYYDLPKR